MTNSFIKNEINYTILYELKYVTENSFDNIIKKLENYIYRNIIEKNGVSKDEFYLFVNNRVKELINLNVLEYTIDKSHIKRGKNYDIKLKETMSILCSELGIYVTNTNSDYPQVGYRNKVDTILANYIVSLGLDSYSNRII